MKSEQIKTIPFRRKFNVAMIFLTLMRVGNMSIESPDLVLESTAFKIFLVLFLFALNWTGFATFFFVWGYFKKRKENKAVKSVSLEVSE